MQAEFPPSLATEACAVCAFQKVAGWRPVQDPKWPSVCVCQKNPLKGRFKSQNGLNVYWLVPGYHVHSHSPGSSELPQAVIVFCQWGGFIQVIWKLASPPYSQWAQGWIFRSFNRLPELCQHCAPHDSWLSRLEKVLSLYCLVRNVSYHRHPINQVGPYCPISIRCPLLLFMEYHTPVVKCKMSSHNLDCQKHGHKRWFLVVSFCFAQNSWVHKRCSNLWCLKVRRQIVKFPPKSRTRITDTPPKTNMIDTGNKQNIWRCISYISY